MRKVSSSRELAVRPPAFGSAAIVLAGPRQAGPRQAGPPNSHGFTTSSSKVKTSRIVPGRDSAAVGSRYTPPRNPNTEINFPVA